MNTLESLPKDPHRAKFSFGNCLVAVCPFRLHCSALWCVAWVADFGISTVLFGAYALLFGIADEPLAAAVWAPKEEIKWWFLLLFLDVSPWQKMPLWGLEVTYTFNILGFDRTVLNDLMISLDGNPQGWGLVVSQLEAASSIWRMPGIWGCHALAASLWSRNDKSQIPREETMKPQYCPP